MTVTRELAERHYAEHAERPFFGELVEFITSGPIVAMVLEGEPVPSAARQVIGATDPLDAAPGSIRGDFAIEMGGNMVHGSDSPESAAREAELFFPEQVFEGTAPAGESAGPGLGLAAAARDPRASRRPVHRAVPRVDELSSGDPASVARPERARQGTRGPARGSGRGDASAATRRDLGGTIHGKPAD